MHGFDRVYRLPVRCAVTSRGRRPLRDVVACMLACSAPGYYHRLSSTSTDCFCAPC